MSAILPKPQYVPTDGHITIVRRPPFKLYYFFFQSLYLPNFYMNTLTILHFTQQISILRTQSRHYHNPIATNGAGVCQYDITNATANYDTVSMTTLGHQFKDKQIIIATWMHHMYSKKKLAKGGKKPRKVYGPHNCRASTFISKNNQCRGCRCNRYKVHTCTELIKITMNGNGHNNNINSNLIIKQLWMNSIFNQLLDNAFL